MTTIARRIPKIKYLQLVVAGFKVDCSEYLEQGDLVIHITLDADEMGPYDAYEIAYKGYKGEHGPGEMARSKEELEEKFKLIQNHCFFILDRVLFVPNPGQPLEVFQRTVCEFLPLFDPGNYVSKGPIMRAARDDEE